MAEAAITETRRIDPPCHEIGEFAPKPLSKTDEDGCVYVDLSGLACRSLEQQFVRIRPGTPGAPQLTAKDADPGDRKGKEACASSLFLVATS
jgi:hypothetical protein